MEFCALSKPGSWTSRLYEILRPAPHPLAIKFSNSQSQFRHKAGEIWRHALTTSVYHDLAGKNHLLADKSSPSCHAWRRFIRVECLGLSGLLFYEIRLLPGIVSVPSMTTGHEHGLSLESVFGDLEDYSGDCMDVEDLLDIVHAKVVYFPAYACTSFVMGQAINAFFRGQPSLRPRPSLEGFSVPLYGCAKFGLHLSSKDIEDLDEVPLVRVVGADSDGDLSLSCSWQVICDDLSVFDELSLDLDDPHRPLCIRSSLFSPDVIAYPVDFAADGDDDDKDDGNTTLSTIESIGPSTPPRSSITEPRVALEDPARVASSDSILGRDRVLDRPIEPTISMSKIARSSPEHTPAVISSGTFCLPVYDDLASFLDIGS